MVEFVNLYPLLQEFIDIVIWPKGSERAPHRPLLILYALGALSRGVEKISFIDLEGPVREVLRELGYLRMLAFAPQEPVIPTQKSLSLESKTFRISFTQILSRHLRQSHYCKISCKLPFHDTLHAEIIERCGIELQCSKKSIKRDPEFRGKILTAYQYSRAIGNLEVQLDGRHLALETVHIKWHAEGRSDDKEMASRCIHCTINYSIKGLSLCLLGALPYPSVAMEIRALSSHCFATMVSPSMRRYLPYIARWLNTLSGTRKRPSRGKLESGHESSRKIKVLPLRQYTTS
ncbi:hypothetical protein Q4488_04520 [Amphritea sp. 1_MG-2023]|nr:hypothetical protein [Amphritea sp. 1_MG-2023]MDO6562644.1 hypothetical protein [Amphritea sp. 1_MG-2023]